MRRSYSGGRERGNSICYHWTDMPPLIRNNRTLAITPLRRDALAILESGLAAVDTRDAVRRTLTLQDHALSIGRHRVDLRSIRNIYVIAVGKAALDASRELERILGKRIRDGVALDLKSGSLRRMSSRAGTHPFPSLPNMKATGEIIGLLKHVNEHDLVIAVISGGGSTLLCWPTELTCADLTVMIKTLMHRGATIDEMNTIRKHTSDILGGQLVALAAPARVVGLIFSDVPGDDIACVASGPTVLDNTTVSDAKRILEKYDLLRACKLPFCNLRETPKDSKLFRHVTNVMAASGSNAVDAMRNEAVRRGYRVRILSKELTGEARDVGRRMARGIRPGEALLACGETTVTIRGHGKGGRNQELALGALADLPEDGLVISCASDGIDNTPAAGAIADNTVRQRAKMLRMDPTAFLERNDSFSFFRRASGQILTGQTGRNVSDVMIGLRAKGA